MERGTLFKIHALNIETTDKLIPTGIGISYTGSFIFFYGNSCINQFYDWLASKQITGTFFTYNLTICGLLLLNVIDTRIVVNGIYARGEIYQLTLKTYTSTITIKCIFKLFPIQLFQLAKLLNLTVQNVCTYVHHTKHDWNIIQDNQTPADSNTVLTCCKLKIVIIQKAVNWLNYQFLNFSDLNVLSISGLATKIFCKKYNAYKLNLVFNSEQNFLIRRAFWGGRCEVFGNLEFGDILHYFDFPGMYASVMQQSFCFGKSHVVYDKLSISSPGYYHVTVTSVSMAIPLLPMKNSDGQIFFPNGTWTGTYWWEELLFFTQNGGIIKKIHFHIAFEKNDYILREFSQHFTKLRKRDALSKIFYKLFINSLYGRLGINETNESTDLFFNRKNLNTTILETSTGGLAFLATTEKKQNLDNQIAANVAVAAAIAAKARLKLNKAILEVERQGGRVLYVDTDSIYAAFKTKMCGIKHGDVTWDSNTAFTFTNAIFATTKGYALQNQNTEIIKLRGFQTNALTFAEFKKHFETDLVLKKTQHMLLKTTAQIQLLALEKKILLNSYNKRIFNTKKTRTKPHFFSLNEKESIN